MRGWIAATDYILNNTPNKFRLALTETISWAEYKASKISTLNDNNNQHHDDSSDKSYGYGYGYGSGSIPSHINTNKNITPTKKWTMSSFTTSSSVTTISNMIKRSTTTTTANNNNNSSTSSTNNSTSNSINNADGLMARKPETPTWIQGYTYLYNQYYKLFLLYIYTIF